MIPCIYLSNIKWSSSNLGSSQGMLSKSTIKKGEVTYHVKMSSYNEIHGVYGIESISEVIASRLARILGIDCADYKLYNACVSKGGKQFWTYLCISKDFTGGRESISFEKAYKLLKLKHETPLEFVKRTGNTYGVYRMFIFDYIINNMDRHGANIELCKNNLKFLPLFDNGNSLYSSTDEERIKNYYYGDSMNVNNFIGSRSLLNNLKEIDLEIGINKLCQKHRQTLFKDLSNVISRDRRDTIWRHIVRRYEHAREICHFQEVKK